MAMATWRYLAHYWQEGLERTRPYDNFWGAGEEGIGRIDDFLKTRRDDFGKDLRWVALERSESGANWQESGDWVEVQRLQA